MAGIVIIGAGQAGSSLAIKARALGYAGDVTLIGAEPVPPYQRPPLSKKYLLGEMDVERLYLRPEAFYREKGIKLRTGSMVSGIDRNAKTIALGTELVDYGQLALTTGSVPIALPEHIGGRLSGVYMMRSLLDANAMAPEFVEGRHVLIIGGGYIGLEAAAVAASKGLRVTLVEMGDRILQRVAAPETSAYFRALHHARGVDLREGVGLAHLDGDTRVRSATLSDGSTLDLDFAIVGIGIRPATDLAMASGLDIDNGIKVDGQGRTSDQAIFAAGDCTSFPYRGGRIRLESVPNAIEQAESTAAAMLGGTDDYIASPWFWSDQYDVKLQIAGLNSGYESVGIRDSGSSRSHWYFRNDTLLAVDAMNDPRAYMVAKRLIAEGKSPDRRVVSDIGADLKTLLA